MLIFFRAACLAAALTGVSGMVIAQSEPVALRPTPAGSHSVTLRQVDGGAWEIVTTGPDPYLFMEALPGVPPPHLRVLAFEYACAQGTDNLQVYLGPPWSEANSVTGPGLALAEGWASHAVDLGDLPKRAGGQWRTVRLDPGNHAGKTILIRKIVLREPTARERELEAQEVARMQALAQQHRRLEAYLARDFPCAVTRVEVSKKEVTITGSVRGDSEALYLADLPIWVDATHPPKSTGLTPLGKVRSFRIALPRFAGSRDRLLSRWAVVRVVDGRAELQSSARYADAIVPVHSLPALKPRGRKGLGGYVNRPNLNADLDDLGIASVTVNVVLNELVATGPRDGWTAFRFGGRTWYANEKALERHDATLREAARRNIMVSAILLIAQGYNAPEGEWSRIVAHPDAHPSGIFVMPNMESEDGVLAYAAALDLLARRYCSGDPRRGRIHHWILHNEINAGWIWTNAGEKTDTLYMDLYHRSMRLAHLVARSYDAHSRTFVSLEHHWNYTPEPRFYRGKRLLDLLLDYSRVEGDFEWSLAFHPYPDSLAQPRTWEDAHTDFTLDTPKITFRNVEVLEAWTRQRRTWYLGKVPRRVHFSEQGLNSPDYSEKSLAEQAAGMAYAWKKIAALACVEAFQYHAWIDNRAEFGLRLGLRKFPDEPDDPYGKKPIWEVYRAIGTPDEDRVLEPYKSIVGVRDWSEVVHRVRIQ